jgi:pantothenate kinase type III
MAAMTPEEAQSYFKRWDLVRGAEAAELPRTTIDALAIVPEADWAEAVESACRYGIVPRIEGALEFARRSRGSKICC